MNEEYKKRSTIWECARLELTTLREYMSSCIEHLQFWSKQPPDADRWEQISLAAEMSFYMIEHVTDLLDMATGDPPEYMRTAVELMERSMRDKKAPAPSTATQEREPKA